MSLFRKKPLNQVLEDTLDPNAADGHVPDGHTQSGGLKRHLGATHLTALGIGAIIGAGIFSLTGTAAANYAGPGIVYSFVIAGVLCALAGLCYSELASMIPVAGSAYTYSYTTMGELIAWIIGWDLILEYTFGAVTVSIAWSGYLYSLIHNTLGVDLPMWMLRLTQGPWEQVTLPDGTTASGIWNLPATVIAIVLSGVLYRGIRESAWVNNIIVVLKITIVVAFVVLGFGVIDSANLFVNPEAGGLGSLVPAATPATEHGLSFMRYGWGFLPPDRGVLTAAAVVFFAYIGFDAVSTTAQEAKNPGRDLPIGILASLAICTILYILVSLVLTGVVNYTELGVPDPIAVGIDKIVQLREWSPNARFALAFSVKLGALAGLTSVMLVMMLAQARIFYSMSRDGLLPWFSKTHPKFATPHLATIMTGIGVAFAGGLVPIRIVGELVSIGTLLAFVLVCLGVPILRMTNPDAVRPFRVRGPWVVGLLGAAACLWVMSSLPLDTWLRLLVWLVLGFGIYFGYGRIHSKLRKTPAPVEPPAPRNF